jgi:fucose permease
VALAAAASSLFWGGFLAARGLAPLVLLKVRPGRLLQAALVAALAVATLLVCARSATALSASTLLLGLGLAPVFPLALAIFQDRARLSSDSRFVLALSGFGGAVLPWVVGQVSARAGSLRMGLAVIPATLLVMTAMLPLLGVSRGAAMEMADGGAVNGDKKL